jgi:uncharacterized phiE125 gp8 family phage protein
MGLAVITAPTAEPLTTTQAKLFLRIDTTDEDSFIGECITAARNKVEEITHRQLMTAVYRYSTNELIDGNTILLPKPPVASVAAVNAVNSDGVVSTLSASTYIVPIDAQPGRIIFTTIPDFDSRRPDALRVTFTAGYGTASSYIPPALIQATYLLLEPFYRRAADQDILDCVESLVTQHIAWRTGA